MAKTPTRPSAVYRGVAVKTFASDLSNYSELRRGLSPVMRGHTLTKTELLKADAGTRERYIDALNQWRQLGQSEKKSIGRQMKTGEYRRPIESIFDKALKTGYFSPAEAARIETAKLEILVRDPEEVEARLRESLNARDRLHGKDWYAAKYFMDEDEFDPEKATDDMLRDIIAESLTDDVSNVRSVDIINEYLRRMGTTDLETAYQGYTNEKARYMQDILAIAEAF